jgi:hypothetical protein
MSCLIVFNAPLCVQMNMVISPFEPGLNRSLILWRRKPKQSLLTRSSVRAAISAYLYALTVFWKRPKWLITGGSFFPESSILKHAGSANSVKWNVQTSPSQSWQLMNDPSCYWMDSLNNSERTNLLQVLIIQSNI